MCAISEFTNRYKITPYSFPVTFVRSNFMFLINAVNVKLQRREFKFVPSRTVLPFCAVYFTNVCFVCCCLVLVTNKIDLP